jgi:hypothetical protein
MEDKYSSSPETITLTKEEAMDKVNITREAAKEAAKNLKKYGSTPVIYGPTRGMLRKPAKLGLRNDIENATTVAEVKSLVAKGKTEYARR